MDGDASHTLYLKDLCLAYTIRGEYDLFKILLLAFCPTDKISSRPEAKALVDGVPGNIHQGFESRYEAECAYVVAFALGALCILQPRSARGQQPAAPAPAIPMPEALMVAFASSSEDFLGAEWHVIFKGKRPGVYPAW